jgi:gliding-associated putative ABC transporter substrate-binding component GldG
MSKKNRSPRFRDLSELLIGIACVLLMLFIGSFTVLRADLTSEKRYTLKPATEEVVKGLDDVVFVKVYLSGDLPADLRQLAQSFRELLDELRIRQPELLQYEFVDPNASPDEKTRREMYADLQKKGLQYTSVRIKDKGAYGERIVFPGAIITYKDKSLPVQLLKTQLRQPDAEMVNRSINNLEYELASAIRQVTARRKPRIAFLEGHGELDELSVKDISN